MSVANGSRDTDTLLCERFQAEYPQPGSFVMEKNPITVIADPETHEFYRALPLWDERIEIYPVANPPHRNGPLRADLILIDCGFDDDRGLCLLREVKLSHPEIPVMLITNAG